MAVRYKVVDSQRKSCLVNYFSYSITYNKGKIAKAIPGSVGIFTFKTKYDAVTFINSPVPYDFGRIILRVEGIGRGFVPKMMSASYSSWSIMDTINHIMGHGIKTAMSDRFFHYRPPIGTICYKAVRVID